MAYSDSSAHDLIADSHFRQWVLAPTPEADQFWASFQAKHPEQRAIVEQARQLVLTLQQATKPTTESELPTVEAMWQSLQTQLDNPGPVVDNTPVVRFLPKWTRWVAAACLLLVAGWGWVVWQQAPESGPTLSQTPSMTGSDNVLEAFNQTTGPLTIILSDSSAVTLQPNSRLQYPAQFAANQRRVGLQGEGFFDVAKNPARPFLVYTHKTVTKVVGTSFRIRAFESEKTVRVVVRTGRVMVFSLQNFKSVPETPQANLTGLVLTPNQRATFDNSSEQFAKDLIEQPLPLPTLTQSRELVFEDRPVSEVFTTLERLYGLEIVFDADVLRNCPITTTLVDEGLHQRLARICRAIGATYEVVDGQIIINSSGCSL